MLKASQKPMYFIPGWGFSAKALHSSALNYLNAKPLDYTHIARPTLERISMHLATKIADNATLVAWSLGGLFAIHIAHLFPKKIKKLILINSQPRFLADVGWPGIDPNQITHFKALADTNLNQLLTYFVKLVNYPNRVPRYKKILNGSILGDNNNLPQLLDILLHSDLRNEYKNIKANVLHIYGARDALIDSRQTSFNLPNINIKKAVIDQAGHAGFITHQKSYQKVLNEFLANA